MVIIVGGKCTEGHKLTLTHTHTHTHKCILNHHSGSRLDVVALSDRVGVVTGRAGIRERQRG